MIGISSWRPFTRCGIFALAIYRSIEFSAARATLPLPFDTEVLINAQHCASNHTVECYTSLVAPAKATDDSSKSRAWCSNVYFGTHHKTGTVLSEDFERVWCNSKSIIPTDEHISLSTYVKGKKIAHFIRDPLEMIVSAYQYHLVSTEGWLIKTGHQSRLRAASLHDGLELEYKRSTNYDIKQMIDFYAFMHVGERSKNVFTIRLEHVRDEFNFRVIEASLKRWFGAHADDITPWEDLTECCFVTPEKRLKGGEHVSKVDEKAMMRKIVMDRHGEEINHMRRQLGFPLTGMEGKGSVKRCTLPDAFAGNTLVVQMLYLALLIAATCVFTLKIFTKVAGRTI